MFNLKRKQKVGFKSTRARDQRSEICPKLQDTVRFETKFISPKVIPHLHEAWNL